MPYPSLKKMAARTGYSERHIHTLKQSLVEAGYLRLVTRRAPAAGKTTTPTIWTCSPRSPTRSRRWRRGCGRDRAGWRRGCGRDRAGRRSPRSRGRGGGRSRGPDSGRARAAPTANAPLRQSPAGRRPGEGGLPFRPGGRGTPPGGGGRAPRGGGSMALRGGGPRRRRRRIPAGKINQPGDSNRRETAFSESGTGERRRPRRISPA